jgi:hypothetical protein
MRWTDRVFRIRTPLPPSALTSLQLAYDVLETLPQVQVYEELPGEEALDYLGFIEDSVHETLRNITY